MPRVIDAFAQFFDGDGDPLRYGWLYFLVSGTNNTEKDTYADIGEETLNTNPLQLDGEGRCPNVYGTGAYRVISYQNDEADDSPGQMIQMFDPVGGSSEGGYFSDWNAIDTYPEGFIVVGDDGSIYRALEGNQGYAPSLNDERWEELEFVRYYNQYVVYSAGDVARDKSTGIDYISQVDENLGNTPSIDTGENWKTTDNDDILIMTGGGALTLGRTHSITDSETYTLPLASSVEAGGKVVVELSDANSAETPTVEADGTDTITDVNGIDADGEVLFNLLSSVSVTFISDGVSDWEI
jgi:hypothetical protein